jgi:hypothetical protein
MAEAWKGKSLLALNRRDITSKSEGKHVQHPQILSRRHTVSYHELLFPKWRHIRPRVFAISQPYGNFNGSFPSVTSVANLLYHLAFFSQPKN